MIDRIREMLSSNDPEMKDLGLSLKVEMELENKLHLDTFRDLQDKYPHLIVGGSSALFLHGVRLSRWSKRYGTGSDLDIITPFYTRLEGISNLQFANYQKEKDFDEVYTCNGFKIDVRVDPYHKWETIEKDGYTYKVTLLQTILDAKIKYSMTGDEKHTNDIYEMIGKIQAVPEKEKTYVSAS